MGDILLTCERCEQDFKVSTLDPNRSIRVKCPHCDHVMKIDLYDELRFGHDVMPCPAPPLLRRLKK
jgi:uncharacterized C2H2 Zn-finger protein